MSDEEIKTLFNIVDKLEKRIFLLEKVIGKLQLRLGDVVLYIDKKAEMEKTRRVNFVKVLVAICMILQTENVDQKEIKEINLELLEHMVMAMEIFALLIVRTIGGINMEQEPLTTPVEYISLEY